MTTAAPTGDDDPLNVALTEYRELVGGDLPPDRAAFLRARPKLAPELEPLLAGIDALHGVGRQLAGDATVVAPAPPFEPAARVGEFEVLRVIGRGGMGVVYEALETPLGRRVALKVLPADAAIDPHARRRFLHEARTAAVLHHSHIVPVLSVGEAAGVQYYAMPLIDGHSLDAVLRVLRQRAGVATAGEPVESGSKAGLLATGLATGFGKLAPAGPSAGPLLANPRYLDEAVRLAHDAALALASAHEHGVVHRDVKPGNLILDVRGKVWLTDFGVAKVAADGAQTAGHGGTLRYMSPEQAGGRAAEVDERTDVYALGLTLYELLTLRPAFAAASDSDLLRQITGEVEPKPVRAHNPAVSVDLETVVQKASAKDRADRYESAAAFAADLARVRDGLPVEARRHTALQRVRRWARRRRRPLAWVGGALAAGVVLGLGGSTYFLLAAYREVSDKSERLESRERDLMALVEQVNKSELVLKGVPGAQDEQRELVRGVKRALCRAADEPGASHPVRREAVRACLRLVEIEGRQGNQPETVAAAREARERIDALVRDGATTRADRLDQAKATQMLGGSLRAAFTPEAGIDLFRRAEQLYVALDAERPDDPAVLNHLGQIYHILSHDRMLKGDDPAALALAGRGLTVNESLARRYPTGHPMSYSRLTESHLMLAEIHCLAGHPVEAEKHFRSAVENDRLTAREAGESNPARLYTFEAPGFYGRFLVGRGRYEDGRKRLAECVAVATPLVEKYPADREYREGLRRCQMELGRAAYLEGRDDEARRWFKLVAADVPKPAPAEHLYLLATIPVPGVVDPKVRLPEAEALIGVVPDDHQVLVTHALLLSRCGEFDRAETVLRSVAERPLHERASLAEVGFVLALCQARRNALPAAKATFDAAEATNWQDVTSYGGVRVARQEALAAMKAAGR